MLSTLHGFAPALALFAPLLLWLLGLIPVRLANARPRMMAGVNEAAAWLAFACALGAALAHAFDATRS